MLKYQPKGVAAHSSSHVKFHVWKCINLFQLKYFTILLEISQRISFELKRCSCAGKKELFRCVSVMKSICY